MPTKRNEMQNSASNTIARPKRKQRRIETRGKTKKMSHVTEDVCAV